MKSLLERFCEENRCGAESFPREIFWRCLHRHAVLVAPLLGGFKSAHFAADRELITGAGMAVHTAQVREAVGYYFSSPQNRGWLRRRANIRISGRRMLDLASRYLPSTRNTQPLGEQDSNGSEP